MPRDTLTTLYAALGQANVFILPAGDHCCTGVHIVHDKNDGSTVVAVQVRGLTHAHQNADERAVAAEMTERLRTELPRSGWRITAQLAHGLVVTAAEPPLTVPQIATDTARLLGSGWSARSYRYGTESELTGPDGLSFLFAVDKDDLLCVWYGHNVADLPEEPEFPEGADAFSTGFCMDSVYDGDYAELAEKAIRAVTGR
ncbi:hypothetical protein ABZV65_30440 [Streptomyces bauhiniae]|uniref:hypothetical protein n=1 Tax=Streptomyces bauhiniae TaxID=2340725 RepID=UPI0033BD5685